MKKANSLWTQTQTNNWKLIKTREVFVFVLHSVSRLHRHKERTLCSRYGEASGDIFQGSCVKTALVKYQVIHLVWKNT